MIFPLGITLHALNRMSWHVTHNRIATWMCRAIGREVWWIDSSPS
jgi:hypothetical protein